MISFAIRPKSKGDEEKASQALARMIEEDPSLEMHRDPQTHDIILSGTGQLHIEVAVERLKRKYNVEVELQAPKVPYKETIKGKAESQGKYKRQSGGRGQYGDCWLKIEPLPRGAGSSSWTRWSAARCRASSSRRWKRVCATRCPRAFWPVIRWWILK